MGGRKPSQNHGELMSRISWPKFIADLLDNPYLIGKDRETVERYQSVYNKKRTLSQGKKYHLSSIAHCMGKLENPETQKKFKPVFDALNHSQKNELLSGWEVRFLNSIYTTLTKGYNLSARQSELLERTLSKLEPEVIEAEKSEVKSFLARLQSDSDFSTHLQWVADYYETHSPDYDAGFSNSVSIALYQPERFNKHHMNKFNYRFAQKYARRVIEQMSKQPKFDINQHVGVSSHGIHRLNRDAEFTAESYMSFRESGGFVIGHHQTVADAVNGGNYYSVLIISGGLVQIQERFLKKFPKNK